MIKEHIDFKTIREEFSEYEIENGQILKLKHILVDIVNEPIEGKLRGKLGTKDISYVYTPEGIDTTGMEISTPEQVTEKDQVRELSFKPTKEVINIYETEKSLILIITGISKIFLTNKKDKENAPIIRYTGQHGIEVIEKLTFSEPK